MSVSENKSASPVERPNERAGQLVQAVIIAGGMESDRDLVDSAQVRLFVARYGVLIAIVALIGALCGFGLSYVVKKVYRAEVLIASAAAEQAGSPLRSLASQYGALASVAGINLPSGDNTAAISVAMLKSRSFIEGLIRDENLLPVLFADKWDASKKAWKLKPGESPPTLEDGYDVFSTRILSVIEDKKSTLLTVRIQWRDRVQAAQWANLLVARLNNVARDVAVRNADRSIEFLNRELERASTVELRQSVYSLMQSQLDKIMMANARPDFAFNIIDPAEPSGPQRYVYPKRPVFLAGGLFVGLLLGVCYGLVRARLSRSAD